MALLQEWQKISYNQEQDRASLQKFWQNYFLIEKGIYEQILANPDQVIEGTVKELAEKYEFCGREIRKAVINACVSVAMRNCAIVQQNDFIKACEKIKYEEERLANAEDHTQSGRAVSPSQKNIIQEAIKAKLNQEHSEGNGTDSSEPAEKETVPV